MTCPSWVPLHGIAHSFIELCKPLRYDKDFLKLFKPHAVIILPQFEQENQRLVGEMNSLFDEVRQIEGKVVEISRLQEIFTEKVLQQEAEIDNIHQIVVGATENIKEGNEDIREVISQIRPGGFRTLRNISISREVTPVSAPKPQLHMVAQAIKNNAGFRVWILFFLVMCSFSLLFLDWYGS
ncbi:Syntaxin-18 [Varanus komodoensis]|nr:Syntaxin-18 [Varanus komodoensis]